MLGFLVCIALLRGVFANSGQIGHNWDFTFPIYLSDSSNINYLSFFAWNSSNLGFQQHLTAAHLIPNLIYSGLVDIFGTILGSKILLFLVIYASIINFQVLSKLVFKKLSLLEHFGLSLIYGFSPFAFNEIVGGSWYMWLSYSFVPLYLYFALTLFSKSNFRSLLGLSISSIFVVPSLQNFVLIHGLLTLYLFFIYRAESQFWSKIFMWHFLLFLTNFYWIWLTTINIVHLSTQFTSGEFTSQFDQVRSSSQPLSKIFDLTGYLNRHFYFQAIPQKISGIFVQLNYMVWAIGALIYFNYHLNKKVRPFIFLVVIFFFIVKGGLQPFSSLTMFLFEKLPLMSLYRSPQHLMIVPQVIFVFLLGSIISYLHSWATKYVRLFFIFLFIAVYTSGWWYNGDLGHTKMKQAGRDYVDFYTLDPGMKLAFSLAEENKTGLRHLVLPSVQSPIYNQAQHQGSAQGGISEYMYLSTPMFSTESTLLGKSIETAICTGDLATFEKLLKEASVGFVTLRNDISPAFTDCTKTWDWRKTKALLLGSQNLKHLFSTDHTFSFLVTLPLPIISTTETSVDLKVKKDNPTKYTFTVVGDKQVTKIIHNENYSHSWHLTDETGKTLAKSQNLNNQNTYYLTEGLKPGKTYTITFATQKAYQQAMVFSLLCVFAFIFFLHRKK